MSSFGQQPPIILSAESITLTPSSSSTPAPKSLLLCPLCSREFGTKSLSIHFPQCSSKTPHPHPHLLPPSLLSTILTKTTWFPSQILSYNTQAKQIYKQQIMKKCWNCSRYFVEESYEKHKKNCVLINGKIGEEPVGKEKDTSLVMPRTVMCYLCGREFGTSSLLIHQPQCISKFKSQESLKPLADQRPLPILTPELLSFDLSDLPSWTPSHLSHYNTLVSSYYNQKTLLPCQFCSRTFFPESLIKHQKGCKGAPKLRRMNTQQVILEEGRKGPMMLVCWVCGKEFGTLSLKIHMPHCVKKWEVEEGKKEGEGERRRGLECPEEIRRMMEEGDWTTENIEKFNEVSYRFYKDTVLERCPTCDRTFLPEALKKHQHGCRADEKSSSDKRDTSIMRPQTSTPFRKMKSLNEESLTATKHNPSKSSAVIIDRQPSSSSLRLQSQRPSSRTSNNNTERTPQNKKPPVPKFSHPSRVNNSVYSKTEVKADLKGLSVSEIKIETPEGMFGQGSGCVTPQKKSGEGVVGRLKRSYKNRPEGVERKERCLEKKEETTKEEEIDKLEKS